MLSTVIDHKALTVTGVQYRDKISNICDQLNDTDLKNMCIQQDSGKCHTVRETIDLLKQCYPGRVMSRNYDV